MSFLVQKATALKEIYDFSMMSSVVGFSGLRSLSGSWSLSSSGARLSLRRFTMLGVSMKFFFSILTSFFIGCEASTDYFLYTF